MGDLVRLGCTCVDAYEYSGWNVYLFELDELLEDKWRFAAIATKGAPNEPPAIGVPAGIDEGKIDLGLEKP